LIQKDEQQAKTIGTGQAKTIFFKRVNKPKSYQPSYGKEESDEASGDEKVNVGKGRRERSKSKDSV
jgi:hypothetical protein